MDKIEFAKPIAIAGDLCSYFFYPPAQATNELALRVHQFCFPGRLRLAASKAVPFIGLQFGNGYIVYFLLMILLSMSPRFLIQAAHSAGVYFDQAGGTLDTTAIGQVFRHRNSFCLWDFAIPQGRVFAFAEFLLTATTAQIANLVLTVHFSYYQIGATFLTILVAIQIDTC